MKTRTLRRLACLNLVLISVYSLDVCALTCASVFKTNYELSVDGAEGEFPAEHWSMGGSGVRINRHDGTKQWFLRTSRGISEVVFEHNRNRHFEREIDPRNRILDVGTGGGRFVNELRQMNIEADGVDLALTPSQRTRPYFHETDVRQMPFANETFDVAVSTQSLFHRSYAGQHSNEFLVNAISEVFRVLKPGGRLYIADPHRQVLEVLRSGAIPDQQVVTEYGVVRYFQKKQ